MMCKYIKFFLFFLPFTPSTLLAETKIMPLGDSITWDQHYGDSRTDAYRHGYRSYLWYKLQDKNYIVNFVGSRHNGGAIQPSYDGDNNSAWGWKSREIASKVYSYLTKDTPNIILLHIGTNDITNGSPANGVAGVEQILNEVDRFEKNKNIKIKIILARIINLKKHSNWINEFNTKLVAMAQYRIANGDDITIVNMQSTVGWNLIDGIHPDNTGYKKMADTWFTAVEKAIKERNDYAYLVPVYGLLLQ